MWNKNVEVIPIIIEATGVVERNIKKYLQRIPGQHNIYNLQRSAILGSAHILRKVLSIKLDYGAVQDILNMSALRVGFTPDEAWVTVKT